MENNNIKVPLTQTNHEQAQTLAKYQLSVATGKKVYLNSLATSAVQNYLNWMRIESNIHSKCSINATLDNTFILICKKGILHCLPILPKQETVFLPRSLEANYIGAVLVQFQEKLTQVELLGFISESIVEREFSVTKVDPSLDSLIDRVSIKE